MHIPDGYLDPVTSLILYVVTILAVIMASRRYFERKDVDVSYLSVMAAAIFAAQMLNWPLPGGTSAHLVGGALAAIVLGPAGGMLAMFLTLLVQALVMGDGGILALGANSFNMAVVNVLVAHAIYRSLKSILGDGSILPAFFAGWLGVAVAALTCGIELGLSPSFGYPLEITVPVMVGWHLALGLVEGAATALIVRELVRRGVIA